MEIHELLSYYELDTVIIAVITMALTALLKIPIKKLAGKTSISKKITRFITFLPLITGFGVTVLSAYLLEGRIDFTKEFYIQWLSASSLSLALYAFWEKFVPSEKQILSQAEVKANNRVIEQLKSIIDGEAKTANAESVISVENGAGDELTEETSHKKIILTNKAKEN